MNYHNITKCDMLNGEGLRVVLWVSHCPHACVGCHNEQTHAADSGICFDAAAKEELMQELGKSYTSGITFSGGDPLSVVNRAEVLALATACKTQFPTKSIWLYSGYTWVVVQHIPGIELIDVVVDGPYVASLQDNTLRYRGSANQRVIDVNASLAQGVCIDYLS